MRGALPQRFELLGACHLQGLKIGSARQQHGALPGICSTTRGDRGRVFGSRRSQAAWYGSRADKNASATRRPTNGQNTPPPSIAHKRAQTHGRDSPEGSTVTSDSLHRAHRTVAEASRTMLKNWAPLARCEARGTATVAADAACRAVNTSCGERESGPRVRKRLVHRALHATPLPTPAACAFRPARRAGARLPREWPPSFATGPTPPHDAHAGVDRVQPAFELDELAGQLLRVGGRQPGVHHEALCLGWPGAADRRHRREEDAGLGDEDAQHRLHRIQPAEQGREGRDGLLQHADQPHPSQTPCPLRTPHNTFSSLPPGLTRRRRVRWRGRRARSGRAPARNQRLRRRRGRPPRPAAPGRRRSAGCTARR